MQQIEGKSANETLEWLMQHTVETAENAEECLKINYHGNKKTIQALLPLLQSSPDGRIVTVSSVFGQLSVCTYAHILVINIRCVENDSVS